jgi:hypothetical protein
MRKPISNQTDFLAANAHKLNVQRRYSYPSKTDVKNALQESAGAKEFTVVFKNPTATDATVVISPQYNADTLNRTKFGTVQQILDATASTHVFQTAPSVGDGTNFQMACIDAGVTIENFLRMIHLNPTRIVGLSMDSRTISDGKQESTNYNKKFKTFYFDALEPQPATVDKPIRPLLSDAFNIGILSINFVKEKFLALVSAENFFQMQVARGTELTVTFHIGAISSNAQRMFRDLKESDEVIRQATLIS